MGSSRLPLFVTLSMALVIGVGWFLYSVAKNLSVTDELQIGFLVVGAIATFMTLLFILAAGFSAMNLTDPKQALGLPEGSIRAMIALILILVFVIFGIYLFHMTGTGTTVYLGTMAKETLPASMTIAGRPIKSSPRSDGGYDVWLVMDVDQDAKKLATQLISIVGTLVVAVSGFYFGSATSTTAARREREELAAAQDAARGGGAGGGTTTLKVTGLTPGSAKRGTVTLTVTGQGFKSAASFRLVRGTEQMAATEVTSPTPTTLRGTIAVDKEPGGGSWDLEVQNPDGATAPLPAAFTISP
jgi:hypothetical protein